MRWLINLFNRIFGKKVLLALPVFSKKVPETFDVEIVEEAVVKSQFQLILESSLREAAEEKFQQEEKLLSDENLPKYFAKCVKYLANHLDTDSYDFILIHARDAGVNEKVFHTFIKIFIKAAAQIGLNAEANKTYLMVRKPNLRKLLEAKEMPKIDIDEKVRKMLHTGIYR